MGALAPATVPVDVGHIIQTSLAPIFLLTGIGSLLNVFNQRLVRVSDHAEHINDLMQSVGDEPAALGLYRHLLRLQQRRLSLDVAVIFAGLGGAFTCAAALTLFLVTLHDAADSLVLLWLFGLALGCTIGSLTAFIADTVLAWHGIKREGPMPRSKPA